MSEFRDHYILSHYLEEHYRTLPYEVVLAADVYVPEITKWIEERGFVQRDYHVGFDYRNKVGQFVDYSTYHGVVIWVNDRDLAVQLKLIFGGSCG